MDPTYLESLRETLINAPEGAATRVIFLAGSFALATVILYLVRTRALREEYTAIWMAVAIGLVIVSVRMDVLRAITRLIGAWTPSATLFFLGELFLVIICLNFAVRLSRMSVQLRSLAQEVALLRATIEEGAKKQP